MLCTLKSLKPCLWKAHLALAWTSLLEMFFPLPMQSSLQVHRSRSRVSEAILCWDIVVEAGKDLFLPLRLSGFGRKSSDGSCSPIAELTYLTWKRCKGWWMDRSTGRTASFTAMQNFSRNSRKVYTLHTRFWPPYP